MIGNSLMALFAGQPVRDCRLKCHDDLSIGVGGDDAVFLLEVLVAVTGSNTGSSSPVGGCWVNGIRGSSIWSFSQRSLAAR